METSKEFIYQKSVIQVSTHLFVLTFFLTKGYSLSKKRL